MPDPVVPESGLSLSALLHPDDAARLAAAGQKAEEHTSLTLVASGIGVSPRQPDGSYIITIQIKIPPGLLKEKSKILLPGSSNPLDDVLGVLPSVTLPVRIDRLGDATRGQLERHLVMALTPKEGG